MATTVVRLQCEVQIARLSKLKTTPPFAQQMLTQTSQHSFQRKKKLKLSESAHSKQGKMGLGKNPYRAIECFFGQTEKRGENRASKKHDHVASYDNRLRRH